MTQDAGNVHLHRQLVKLGDMMGDGLHLEPDGKWIAREYRQTMRALGMRVSKPRDVDGINLRVANYLSANPYSPCCSSGLTQTRSGSLRVKCEWCGNKYQLGSRKK